MKLRAKLLVRLLKKAGIGALKKRKGAIIKILNEKIDLPKLDEAQEERLLEAVYQAAIDMIENL